MKDKGISYSFNLDATKLDLFVGRPVLIPSVKKEKIVDKKIEDFADEKGYIDIRKLVCNRKRSMYQVVKDKELERYNFVLTKLISGVMFTFEEYQNYYTIIHHVVSMAMKDSKLKSFKFEKTGENSETIVGVYSE